MNIPTVRSVARHAVADCLRLGTGAFVLALSLGLTGCVSGGFHSNAPLQQQYLLHWSAAPSQGTTEPAPSATTPAAAAGLDASRSLEVLLPTAAPGLEGDGIAVMQDGERLDYYRGARWAASIPQMLQGLAVEALRAQGRFVLIEPEPAPFAAGWVLDMEIAHFEAEQAGDGPPTVQVKLVCTLGQRSASRAVATVSIETKVTATANRLAPVLDAFEQATTGALQQCAARLSP